MRIREANIDDSAGIARVRVDTWRTTYAGIVPDDHLAGLSYGQDERRRRERFPTPDDARFVYVAEENSGEIVGYASAGPERGGDPEYKGELYAIYLLPAYQRKGIGRQLTLTVARRLLQQGFRSMLVWVLVENPSRGFYKALGGKPLYEKPLVIGGAELIKVAYGWQDLHKLVKTQTQREE